LGVVSGFAALILGPLGSRTARAVTALFLATTLATSLTGFMFPFTQLGPGHVTGALTLVALIPALLALYHYRLAGPWRRIYTTGAAVALYLNVFIAVLQAFGKMNLAASAGARARRAAVARHAARRAGAVRCAVPARGKAAALRSRRRRSATVPSNRQPCVRDVRSLRDLGLPPLGLGTAPCPPKRPNRRSFQ
jgi:hypothetical protein